MIYPVILKTKKMEYDKAFPFFIDETIKNNDGNFVHSKNLEDIFTFLMAKW